MNDLVEDHEKTLSACDVSEMKCGFVLLTACLFFVLRLRPPFSDSAVPRAEIVVELPGSSNIRFAPYLVVDGQDFVSSTRIHRPFLSQTQTAPCCRCLAWLLLAAGDVEANPGPGLGLRQARKFKFPCGVCSAPVKSNQRGVHCECCYYWLHARCIGMDGEEYTHLQNSTDPWCCKKCLDEALPFFSVSNSDSIFDCSSSSSSSSPSTPSVCNTTQPQLPTPPHLTFLNLNCRSLLPKLDDLHIFAEAQSPDVITLCETWLDDSIKNDEVAIEGYVLVRWDRNRQEGVLACISEKACPSHRL